MKDLEKELRGIVGDHVTTSILERKLYASDFVSIPKIVKSFFRTMPEAVVKPLHAAHVADLLKYCSTNGIPVTPRGAGSSGLFGSVPKKGGIVVDLRALCDIVDVDREQDTVTVGAGCNWAGLDRELLMSGLKRLGAQQEHTLADNSPLLPVLEDWLRVIGVEGAREPRLASGLYEQLSDWARQKRMEWPWRTPHGFASHLKAVETTLKAEHDMVVTVQWNTYKGRNQTFYSFGGCAETQGRAI